MYMYVCMYDRFVVCLQLKNSEVVKIMDNTGNRVGLINHSESITLSRPLYTDYNLSI